MGAAEGDAPRPPRPDPARPVRLRVDLAYDGAGFAGFARQPDQRTVQGVLEGALSRLCGTDVTTTGAGRTDAGVHATAQVVSVDVPPATRLLDDLDRARSALDRLCGPELAVLRVRRVPSSFDARFSATQRRYRYRLCDAPALLPLERHDTWHVGPPALDVQAMAAGARLLVGEHDFSSFCRRPPPLPGGAEPSLVRRVDDIRIRRRPRGHVLVLVDGRAFCHQMVRSIVGCLVRVGRGAKPAEWLGDVLAAHDRNAASAVAPAHGLTLVRVVYG